MSIKGTLAIAALACFLGASSADAVTITLSQAELDAFVGTSCSPAPCTQFEFFPPTPTTYSVFWGAAGPTTGDATFSSQPLSIAFETGDVFSINVFNSNASVWEFAAIVHTSIGDFIAPYVPITAGVLSVVLTGPMEPGDVISGVDLLVRGPIPNLDNPDNFEDRLVNFNLVAAVPEPGTVVFLGAGLLGLAVAARRRRAN